jgi:hypothetical protein
MAGAIKKNILQEDAITEIELDASENLELDRLADEIRMRGISWGRSQG